METTANVEYRVAVLTQPPSLPPPRLKLDCVPQHSRIINVKTAKP